MIIGIDFDNTIVCYDQVFHAVALERNLIPSFVPATKSDVRNFLQSTDRKNAWIELQGYVYGEGMERAEAFPGVEDFFLYCRNAGIAAHIISHKTRYPFIGPAYDLHEYAQQWLLAHGFYSPEKIGLPRESVFFELTIQAKLDRIRQIGCEMFLDDLPEVLSESNFPDNVARLLFDSSGNASADVPFTRVCSWNQMKDIVCGKMSHG